MITMTQGDYTFKNRVDSVSLVGLFEIKKVVKRRITREELGIVNQPDISGFVSPCLDYCYVDKDWMKTAGDPKPYGAIVVTPDYACILYDVGLANLLSDGAIVDGGFVIVWDDSAAPEGFQASSILPTQHFSNPFSRLYGIRPSGVVALPDRVISAYNCDVEDDSICADYVAYSGIDPLAAFGVHQFIAPTIFLPYASASRKEMEQWIVTAGNALKKGLFYGTVPPKTGFVASDYTTSVTGKALKSLRKFSRDFESGAYLVSAKPKSSASSLTGMIRSVVTRSSLFDPDVVANITSGILTETRLIAVLNTNDLDPLCHFGEGSEYDYYVLADDFASIINTFNEKYLEVKDDAIRATYAQLVGFTNQAIQRFQEIWAASFAEGVAEGVRNITDVQDSILKEEVPLFVPEDTEPVTVELDVALLNRFVPVLPTFFRLGAVTPSEMQAEIDAHLPYFVNPAFDEVMRDAITSGTQDELIDDFVSALPDGPDGVVRGVPLYDLQTAVDSCAAVAMSRGNLFGSSKVREVVDGISVTSVQSPNLEAVTACTSNRFWGLQCSWFLQWSWAQTPTYRQVDGKHARVTKVNVILNPLNNKYKLAFDVDCAAVKEFYGRVTVRDVLRQNGNILIGGLPSEYSVRNVDVDFSRRLGAPNLGDDYHSAFVTRHKVLTPWIEMPVLEFSDASPATTMGSTFVSLFSSAVTRNAGSAAYHYIAPMLESISSVAAASAIGFCNGAYLRLVDVTRVASFDFEYLSALQAALESVKDKLDPASVTNLDAFLSNLDMAINTCTKEPLYYLTRSSLGFGSRVHDVDAAAIAVVHGGNIVD